MDSAQQQWIFPQGTMDRLAEIFAPTVAQNVEHLLMLFGNSAERHVTDIVQVTQRVGASMCDIAGEGAAQLTEFADRSPEQLVGWLHSHHKLQGVPSWIDVESHRKQQNYGRVEIMAIYHESSEVESTRGLRMWMLDPSKTDCKPTSETAPLSFLLQLNWCEGTHKFLFHNLGIPDPIIESKTPVPVGEMEPTGASAGAPAAGRHDTRKAKAGHISGGNGGERGGEDEAELETLRERMPQKWPKGTDREHKQIEEYRKQIQRLRQKRSVAKAGWNQKKLTTQINIIAQDAQQFHYDMSERARQGGLTALGRYIETQKKLAKLARELAEAAEDPVGELEQACDHFQAYDKPTAAPRQRARAQQSKLKRPATAKIVSLPIMKKYFEDIASNRKKTEYRADTLYYKRLLLNQDKPVNGIRFRKGRLSKEVLTKEVRKIAIVNVCDYVDEVDEADREMVFKGNDTAIRIELGETVELASDADCDHVRRC